MQTHFPPALLENPDMAQSEKILRACVHCGFCTATCPTFLLTGDELDSPRGRIYLIKEMLEHDRPADARTTRHLDRCLSCLGCMTTCPSSVHYMHLVDHARAHVETTYVRPLPERGLRAALAFLLTRPRWFRLGLRLSALARPLQGLMPKRVAAMLALAPRQIPKASDVDRPQVFSAQGERKMRVALLNGCAQKALDPAINEATVRLLTRFGVEVVVAQGAGCCGALAHHLGKTESAYGFAARNIDAWTREIETSGLDRVVINTSGCGTTVKDYGFMFRNDPVRAEAAAHIASIARDVSEVLAELAITWPHAAPKLRVAYHSACSLQHGQGITGEPLALLEAAGFETLTAPEGHICCGSAGTYNLLQPEMAEALRARKVADIETLAPDAVVAGNLGCITQIAAGTEIPVLHLVELLDWASGGPKPAKLSAFRLRAAAAPH
ncbi:MAG TPA: glycolate oxidase subunit GlcF [Methylocystis sp.]|nr:glycolate oxidase subunit GlcF [Methylocystis sp.]